MFLTKKDVRDVVNEVLSGPDNTLALKKDIERLNKEVKELELKKRLEEEEIKHLVKMKEEKQSIDAQKKELELGKQFNEKEMKLQTEYHQKVVDLLQQGQKNLQDIYAKIMERLPNVSMNIERKERG